MFLFFFFKQKTAYEMRISDWSSDVCSSDLWWRPAMTKSATPAAIRSHFSDVCERLGSYQTINQTMEPIAQADRHPRRSRDVARRRCRSPRQSRDRDRKSVV